MVLVAVLLCTLLRGTRLHESKVRCVVLCTKVITCGWCAGVCRYRITV